MNTVVSLFENQALADEAVHDLEVKGFPGTASAF